MFRLQSHGMKEATNHSEVYRSKPHLQENSKSGLGCGLGRLQIYFELSPGVSTSCYRPQRNRGKVMFLHLSVILFPGVEVADTPPQGADTIPQSRHPPRGADPPAADPPKSRQHPPPRSAYWEIWATGSRYAPYWNAYLLCKQLYGTPDSRLTKTSLFFFNLNRRKTRTHGES